MNFISRRIFLLSTGALLVSPTVAEPAIADAQSDRRKVLGELFANINRERVAKEMEIAAAGKKADISLFTLPPRVIPFLDWDYFYIDESLLWAATNSNSKLPAVRVPKGFVTDLASIPQPLWSVLPKTGRYAYPAVIHDYLYWTQETTRKVADDVLMEAMIELNVSMADRISIYGGVRTHLGQAAWDKNRRAKDGGEKRVLKKFPADSLVAWSKWKATPGVF